MLRGEKEFALLPPAEGHLLGRRPFRAATWTATCAVRSEEETAGCAVAEASEAMRCGLQLRADEPKATVPWTEMDLERDGAERGLRPIRATVHAGELLYLPALWWHAVSQRAPSEDSDAASGGRSTIAVNYWYEGPVALGDEASAAADRAADRLLASLSLSAQC